MQKWKSAHVTLYSITKQSKAKKMKMKMKARKEHWEAQMKLQFAL